MYNNQMNILICVYGNEKGIGVNLKEGLKTVSLNSNILWTPLLHILLSRL